MKHPAIAIDGPAASGKSTVARIVAEKLDYTFINTGAMYRAVTWYILKQGISPHDNAAIVTLLKDIPLSFGKKGSGSVVLCDGKILESELTAYEVNANVSTVSAIPEVRALLIARQREYNRHEAIVMEGRDIGSVVFPDTPFKYYITASEEVRAARRAAQGLEDSISERDKKDSSRSSSPLIIPEGSRVIDTSGMTIEEVVFLVIEDISTKLAAL